MNERLLLDLPHRQFVWSIPRILRPYFRHNRRLFSEISRLIFAIIAIVLEGGFDEAGRFVHIPLGNLHRMSEYFRRVIIKFFLKKKLINANLATSLVNWRHSGFSLDNSVHLPAGSTKARKALSQYISRRMAVPPPLSLKKMSIQENGEATVISYTSENGFFQGKTETFSLMRFFLEVTQHIPPARLAVYSAIWTLCLQDQGRVAGDASCGPDRRCGFLP